MLHSSPLTGTAPPCYHLHVKSKCAEVKGCEFEEGAGICRKTGMSRQYIFLSLISVLSGSITPCDRYFDAGHCTKAGHCEYSKAAQYCKAKGEVSLAGQISCTAH